MIRQKRKRNGNEHGQYSYSLCMDDMRLSGCSLMNKVGIKARTENVCISFDLNDTGKTPTLVARNTNIIQTE